MKFLVPNYSCLQNPWLGGYHSQIPILSVLNWIWWPPHPRKKFLGTPLHTTLGGTPLDKWSAWRRDLCLTTHRTHKRQTFMPPTGFETAIPGCERSQNHALDRAANGVSDSNTVLSFNLFSVVTVYIYLQRVWRSTFGIHETDVINLYSKLALLPNTPLCVQESRISLLKNFTFIAVQFVKLQSWDWYK